MDSDCVVVAETKVDWDSIIPKVVGGLVAVVAVVAGICAFVIYHHKAKKARYAY